MKSSNFIRKFIDSKWFPNFDSIEAFCINTSSFEGEMGILKDHIPLITFLRPGKVEVFSKEEQENISFFVSGGFVKIQNNNCLVMVDYIRKTKDIDIKENEKKISELVLKLEKTEDQTIRDKLIIDIDLLKSENQASE